MRHRPDTSAPASHEALEASLRKRERQLAGILDTTMDAIITVDASLRIQLFNRAASEMFGHVAADMLGASLDRLIPLASRAHHVAHVAGYAKHGTAPRSMGSPRPLVGLRADGVEFPIEATISRTGEGDDMLMTAVVRDATRLRNAELDRELASSAEAAHRAKAEFLSRMSHELRTPLNAVLGLTRLLHSSTQERLTPSEAQQFGLVIAAGERLRSLIDDMLAMARESVPAGAAAAVAPVSPGEPSGLVLYIEDEPVNALVVEQLLRCWPGIRVALAPDGRSGIAMARSLQPQLVLLDMHLPDMSGLQVLRSLRDDEATRHLRVAALSAGGTSDEVACALAAGVARYWTKPIDFGPFLAGLRELLHPH